MFGWDRKKKPEKKQESGLMYAGSPATQHREVDLGETHHTYKTEDGTLYMRDTALHLVTKQGTITAPYHTIDVWEYTGKSFHVWWTTSTHNYTFACRPEMSPAEDLQNIIHKKTFEESVLLFEVGRSVGYICK
ncbi:MAG: hypothetical protein F4Z46_04675, partial [Cenarchaeum sp. SB0667_bin_13]|nr:hypothetical protein [Cenarchaeum sp. SB0667_bin_13]MYB47509.1 hypothetical protein [Cenarchaeum sp. SB0662_bin_33]